MAIEFSSTSINGGVLTSASDYASSEADTESMTNDILNEVAGNDEVGFDFQTVVDLSVQNAMGGEIESLKSDITNTNIRITALDSLTDVFQDFSDDILSPLSTAGALSGTYASSSNSQAVTVEVSDPSVAQDSSFNMSVSQLAQSETLSSSLFSEPDAVVGEGVISIEMGAYDDAGNFTSSGQGQGTTFRVEEGMTLEDVALEISSSSDSLSAEVVEEDGYYKLAIFSSETGEDNSLKISVAAEDITENAGINSLAYSKNDPGLMYLNNAAQDAKYTINGVSYESSDNSVDTNFGISVDFLDVSASTFNVVGQSATDGLADNMITFVDAYNEVVDTYNNYISDDSGEDGKGSLESEDIQSLIDSRLSTLKDSLTGGSVDLSELGITIGIDNTMTLDQAALSEALDKSPDLVRSILSDQNTASNAGVSIVSYGNDPDNSLAGVTQDGTYDIEVTAAATGVELTGAAITETVIPAGGSDVSLLVNGSSVDFTIDEGTYSPDALASILSEKVNSASGDTYNVKADDTGAISLTSDAMGSAQTIEFTTGGDVFGLAGATGEGTDIQGRINGVLALGAGTQLTGILTDDSKGLTVDINSNHVGDLGSVTIQRGALTLLDVAVDDIAATDGSYIADERDAYSLLVDETDRNSYIYQLEEAEDREDTLTARYNALYTSSQARITASQSNLDLINTMFNSDSDD